MEDEGLEGNESRALSFTHFISYLLCVYFWCSDIPRSTDIKYAFTFSGVLNITGEQHSLSYLFCPRRGEWELGIQPWKKMIRVGVYNKKGEGDNLLQIAGVCVVTYTPINIIMPTKQQHLCKIL